MSTPAPRFKRSKRPFFHPATRIKPLVAWRAVRRLIANPDETGEVFKVIEALKGRSLSDAVERLAATRVGYEMLVQKPAIIGLLDDRDALRALPEGSLGRAYLDFVESGQLSAEGLVEASTEAPRYDYLTPEERWMGDRLRDIHDLQHVLTGYGRDELGELCLLGFMNAQTYNRGIRFIAFMGRRKYRALRPELPIDACADEGVALGKAANWLPGMRWEDRLAEPLEALRAKLGLKPPKLYLDARTRWGN